MADHIGWNPGAAGVARRLAAHLDFPLVSSGKSRLAAYCNRIPGHAESIAKQNADLFIPGTLGLPHQERSIRIDVLFRPYHDAVARLLDRRSHRPTLLINTRSLAPVLNGQLRPWHIGISLWATARK